MKKPDQERYVHVKSIMESVYGNYESSIAPEKDSPFTGKRLKEYPLEEMEAILAAEELRLRSYKDRKRAFGIDEITADWVLDLIAGEMIERSVISLDNLLASGKALGFSNKARSCRCLAGGCTSRTKRCMFDPTQQDFLIGGL